MRLSFFPTIIITNFTYLRQFWVVFWAIYHKFFHWIFFSTFIAGMTLMIINDLPRICNFAAIFPDLQMLIYYIDSKAFLFSSDFFELHSLLDFVGLTSLFLSIWLNFDSSLTILYMVHIWGIFLCFFNPNKHLKMDRKNDSFTFPKPTFYSDIFTTYVWLSCVSTSTPRTD